MTSSYELSPKNKRFAEDLAKLIIKLAISTGSYPRIVKLGCLELNSVELNKTIGVPRRLYERLILIHKGEMDEIVGVAMLVAMYRVFGPSGHNDAKVDLYRVGVLFLRAKICNFCDKRINKLLLDFCWEMRSYLITHSREYL